MSKKRLVILGTGFAAFSLIRKINTQHYEVKVVSPRNHFLFTPLLPSTTVGTIEFRSIIEPIRVAKPEVEYYQAHCRKIEFEKRVITCQGALDDKAFELAYDFLVVAVGAVSNTFGIPGVKEHACFLAQAADARIIRQRIIESFERASTPGLADNEIQRLLHFVVVGGGPTGVEFAAEMHDFLVEDLVKWYPSLVPHFQITLLEASPHILNSFDASLSDYAMKIFKRQRIEIKTDSTVKGVSEGEVLLQDGKRIGCGLIVWSTGIGPTGLVQSLSLPKNEQGRVLTNLFLQVKGHEAVYAMGDCAVIGEMILPPTAQVAMQVGKYLGKMFNRLAKHKPIKVFHYHHMGMLAYVGGKKALADLPKVKGRGFSTYLFWRSAYLTRLVSLKNKVLVLFDWFKTALFGRDISQF